MQRRTGVPSLIEAGATKPPAAKPKEPKYNFRLSDVQAFYDLQVIKGAEEEDALEATIEKFDLPAKDVEVNPVGMLIIKGLEPESETKPEGGIIPGGGDQVATGAGSALSNATKSTEISFKQNEPAGGNAPGGNESVSESDDDEIVALRAEAKKHKPVKMEAVGRSVHVWVNKAGRDALRKYAAEKGYSHGSWYDNDVSAYFVSVGITPVPKIRPKADK